MKHTSFRALAFSPLPAVALVVWLAAPASAEPSAAGAAASESEDRGDDPSANCAVDAGSRNLANGTACQNDGQCDSGFCSKSAGSGGSGICEACGGCRERTIHNVDTVNECISSSGEHKCSSAKHFPCAGTHDNVNWEKCIPNPAGRPIVRRGVGVRCLGPAPVVQATCDGTMTTNCGNGGPQVSSLWRNDALVCP